MFKIFFPFTALLILFWGSNAFAANELDTGSLSIVIPAIPEPLKVVNSPICIRANADGSLYIQAQGKTNLFNYPGGSGADHSAPMALFTPDGDFVLTAKVSAPLKNVYDVAALVIYENERSWAKLCYENSVDKEPTVVSVITRGQSDDCNSSVINAPFVYYAICRKEAEYSFHWSMDGRTWKLVRHFRLDTKEPVRIGFAVHAYCDEPISGTFSEITYTPHAPEQMRLFHQ